MRDSLRYPQGELRRSFAFGSGWSSGGPPPLCHSERSEESHKALVLRGILRFTQNDKAERTERSEEWASQILRLGLRIKLRMIITKRNLLLTLLHGD